ncbi:MAG: Unknown protein [uncultured Sulfurovum sp.]|uniref:DUF676 domain-containing protein n=1 Tax=uncultured Sulfurovum sp. TaxID=269237 RepID=A0A6S6U9V1_9BACT|nr:MAG: Unknown protein [uncultured Sulfurovum sp.]
MHGLGGSKETWGEFPKLIENDEAFRDFDFSIYEYPSSIVSVKDIVSPFSKLLSIFIPPSNLPSIQEIAEGLRSELRIRYAEYEEIYLVTHSMGGLVARKYLIDALKDDATTLRIKKLLLYAVPNNGSDWAELSRLYEHKQIKQLAKKSDFMTLLNKENRFYKLEEHLDVLYVVGLQDAVVDEHSALGYWGNTQYESLHKGHMDIVKPKDKNDLSYLLFRKFMGNENLSVTKSNEAKKTEKLKETPFLKNIQTILTSKRLITLFSQDYKEIRSEQELLKQKMQAMFKENFHHLRIPRVKNNEAKYFELLAKDCAFDASVRSVDAWHREVSTKLSQKPHEKLFFYITDIEHGDEVQNRNFAELIRSLQSEFGNFYAIFVGKRKLASLVYGKDAKLSPLKDIAQKMFFEELEDNMNMQDIRQVLLDLKANGENVCAFLDDEVQVTWDYYSTSVLNTLFWRNLMVNVNDYYQWRDEMTKELAREIFGCDEDVV